MSFDDFKRFAVLRFGSLVGHRITNLVLTGDRYVGLQLDDGRTVWFDRDPEGNGPGWPSLQPAKETV